MTPQEIDKDPWTLEQIRSDAKEDDAYWEAPDFNAINWDIVRLYTQKRSLLKLVDFQAIEIERLHLEVQKWKDLFDRLDLHSKGEVK